MTTVETAPVQDRAHAIPTLALMGHIAGAALVAGSFDLLFAISFWSSQGMPAGTVLRGIASGIYGPGAFGGGPAILAIGLTLHYAMVAFMALVLWMAGRFAPMLARHRWPVGILYGALLYGVMNYIVVPLSRAPLGPPVWPTALADLAAHMCLVGAPLALLVLRRPAQASRCG
jgi:hypothetical protein